jgi:hypothetical protein
MCVSDRHSHKRNEGIKSPLLTSTLLLYQAVLFSYDCWPKKIKRGSADDLLVKSHDNVLSFHFDVLVNDDGGNMDG